MFRYPIDPIYPIDYIDSVENGIQIDRHRADTALVVRRWMMRQQTGDKRHSLLAVGRTVSTLHRRLWRHID